MCCSLNSRISLCDFLTLRSVGRSHSSIALFIDMEFFVSSFSSWLLIFVRDTCAFINESINARKLMDLIPLLPLHSMVIGQLKKCFLFSLTKMKKKIYINWKDRNKVCVACFFFRVDVRHTFLLSPKILGALFVFPLHFN